MRLAFITLRVHGLKRKWIRDLANVYRNCEVDSVDHIVSSPLKYEAVNKRRDHYANGCSVQTVRRRHGKALCLNSVKLPNHSTHSDAILSNLHGNLRRQQYWQYSDVHMQQLTGLRSLLISQLNDTSTLFATATHWDIWPRCFDPRPWKLISSLNICKFSLRCFVNLLQAVRRYEWRIEVLHIWPLKHNQFISSLNYIIKQRSVKFPL